MKPVKMHIFFSINHNSQMKVIKKRKVVYYVVIISFPPNIILFHF